MKVEKVSATIRYSQDTGHGAWKVVELGAEATISDREVWKQAQSELYYQLSHQLRQLWNNGTSAALNGVGGAETVVEPPAEPAPVSGSETQLEHGAAPTKWPTPRRKVRTARPGGATRSRTGAGAVSR